MTATFNLGSNYSFEEDSNGDLVVVDSTGTPVIRHEDGADNISAVAPFDAIDVDAGKLLTALDANGQDITGAADLEATAKLIDPSGTGHTAELAERSEVVEKSNVGASDGIASLNSVGEVPDGQLPPLANVPEGAIVMWSGSITNLPSGWTLCDGTDPRNNSSAVPDLRNRFIAGAGGEYSVGDTGGEKEHQLTEAELPSHTHSVPNVVNTNAAGQPGGDFAEQSGGTSGTTGGDQAHENRPRFYSLAYIYRL